MKVPMLSHKSAILVIDDDWQLHLNAPAGFHGGSILDSLLAERNRGSVVSAARLQSKGVTKLFDAARAAHYSNACL